jgi:hypothetical protein
MLDPRIGVRTMLERPRVDSESGGKHRPGKVQPSETDTCRTVAAVGWLRV